MKNHIILSTALLGFQVLTATGCNSQNSESSAQDTSVKKSEAPATVSDTSGIFYVDVRTPEEFAEGTARGAVNIPLDKIESQIRNFEGKKHIVVFCRSGNRSAAAKRILESHGITNVENGGTWQDVAAKTGTATQGDK